MIFQFNHKFFIAKAKKAYIIHKVLGASSNGRTRDFGSLYHGSNPCAPTRINKNTLLGVFIYSWAHGCARMSTVQHVPFENAVFVGVAHTTCMAYTKISN